MLVNVWLFISFSLSGGTIIMSLLFVSCLRIPCFFQSFSCWFVVAGLWVCQVKQVRSQGDLILYQLKDVLIFSNNCFYFEMFSLIVQNFLSIDINLFVTALNFAPKNIKILKLKKSKFPCKIIVSNAITIIYKVFVICSNFFRPYCIFSIFSTLEPRKKNLTHPKTFDQRN